jgi:hypothetical protein
MESYRKREIKLSCPYCIRKASALKGEKVTGKCSCKVIHTGGKIRVKVIEIGHPNTIGLILSKGSSVGNLFKRFMEVQYCLLNKNTGEEVNEVTEEGEYVICPKIRYD